MGKIEAGEIRVRGWVLVDKKTGKPAQEGEEREDFRGETHLIEWGTPPLREGSTGRVRLASGLEFYPSVVGLKWEREKEKPNAEA